LYITLYIATNCNIVVFMTECTYRYRHTTAFRPYTIRMCVNKQGERQINIKGRKD